MATVADTNSYEPAPPLVAAIDRWIYVFMAALFLATVLAGFVPDSIGLVAAVQAGARPPLPIAMHVHAVIMGSWVTLFCAQTLLMATGRSALHKTLGLASFVLMPAMIVAGLFVVRATYLQAWTVLQSPPAGFPVDVLPAVREAVAFKGNVVLFQIRVGLLFPLLVGIALRARKARPELHKRLMVMATLLPLPAAIDRLNWWPTTLPVNPPSIDLNMLLWLSPMFLWDLYRRRPVMGVYAFWIAVNLPFAIATNLLWGTPWWQRTVPALLGMPG